MNGIHFFFNIREKKKNPKKWSLKQRGVDFNFDLPYDWLFFGSKENEKEHVDPVKGEVQDSRSALLHILDLSGLGK